MNSVIRALCSALEIPAMRLGPGKHLKGRKLMGGLVTPEEYDYFHEVYPSILCLSLKLTYIN